VEVILRLAVGGMYYNSVSSLDGLDEDTLGLSHVGAWYERHGDEILMDLSYCMSSCGITVWVLCGQPHVSYINGKTTVQGRTDRQTNKSVLLTVYANDPTRHVLGRRDGSEDT
jgi:hypothetical protein